MLNSKPATLETKIISLLVLFSISFFMFYLGSGLVYTLLTFELSILLPLFGAEWVQPINGSVIDTIFEFFGPAGITFSLLVVVGYTVPISLLAAIIFHIGFNSNFLNRLSRWWLSQTQGPFARLLKFLGISSFDGTLILKEQMEVIEPDLNSTIGLLKTLFVHIGRTILIPASIVAFIWVFLGTEISERGGIWAFFGNIFLYNIFLYIVIIIIPVIILLLFFPGIKVLEQTGLILVRFDLKKKIRVVSNLGGATFTTVGNILGISAVLFLSSSQTLDIIQTLAAIYYAGLPQLLLNVCLFYPIALLNAFGYLIVLSSFFVPISGFLFLELYPTKVVEAVKLTRVQILNEGIAPFGKVVLKEE